MKGKETKDQGIKAVQKDKRYKKIRKLTTEIEKQGKIKRKQV